MRHRCFHRLSKRISSAKAWRSYSGVPKETAPTRDATEAVGVIVPTGMNRHAGPTRQPENSSGPLNLGTGCAGVLACFNPKWPKLDFAVACFELTMPVELLKSGAVIEPWHGRCRHNLTGGFEGPVLNATPPAIIFRLVALCVSRSFAFPGRGPCRRYPILVITCCACRTHFCPASRPRK
jgi:hypothetical protein